MSETPTTPQEQTTEPKTEHDSFFKDIVDRAFNFAHKHPKKAAAAVVAGALAVPTVVAGGQVVQAEIRQASEDAKQAAIQETEVAQHEDFVEALNANQPADSVIASISINQGGSLEGSVKSELSKEDFANNYDTLHASAAEHSPVQPGEEFKVVDPNKSVEGDAFIVPADQIVYSNITELPTPTIESTPAQLQAAEGSVQVGVTIAPLEEKQD